MNRTRLTLRIDNLNQDGQGIGRNDGLVVFVNGALPGEIVEAVITRRTPRYAEAALCHIQQVSPNRIEPICPLAGICGGCSLLPLSYPAQLRWKTRFVADALTRIGHLELPSEGVRPTIGMREPLRFRAKAQMPVGGSWQSPQIGYFTPGSHRIIDTDYCPVQARVADAVRLALRHFLRENHVDPYRENEHQGLVRQLVVRLAEATGEVTVGLVINGEELPHADRFIDTVRRAVRSATATDRKSTSTAINEDELTAINESASTTINTSPSFDDVGSKTISDARNTEAFHLNGIFLNTNRKPGNTLYGPQTRLIYGSGTLSEQINGIRYEISPLAFFQVNPRQTAHLFREIVRTALPTGESPPQTGFDLYCGSGSITLQLAQALRERSGKSIQSGKQAERTQLIGIESFAPSVADARANITINQLDNGNPTVMFRVGEVESVLANTAAELKTPVDLVVLDPPRKGCHPEVLHTIRKLAPPKVVYVSCNPATLARDLALLVGSDRLYRVQSVQPVDLFPWTGHVECLVLMSRVKE